MYAFLSRTKQELKAEIETDLQDEADDVDVLGEDLSWMND